MPQHATAEEKITEWNLCYLIKVCGTEILESMEWLVITVLTKKEMSKNDTDLIGEIVNGL